MNLPDTDFEANIKKLYKYRDKPVILVCADGYLSPTIGAKLQDEKFAQVFALRGGIRGWKNEDLPLET